MRVVVQRDVDGVAAAVGGAVDEGLQDGGSACYAGAEVGVWEYLSVSEMAGAAEEGTYWGHCFIISHTPPKFQADTTARVADLLPSTSMHPGSVPTIAILLDMNDAPASLLYQLKDIVPAKSILLHHPWSVPLDHDVSFFDQRTELLAIRSVLEMESALPLAP